MKWNCCRHYAILMKIYIIELSLEAVAAHVCLSANYFSRFLKRQGNFKVWVNQRKMQRAGELLGDPSYSVDSVARKLPVCANQLLLSGVSRRSSHQPAVVPRSASRSRFTVSRLAAVLSLIQIFPEALIMCNGRSRKIFIYAHQRAIKFHRLIDWLRK